MRKKNIKRLFVYFAVCFVFLFFTIYVIASIVQESKRKKLNISSSNPSVAYLYEPLKLKSGSAIANPNLNLDVKSSKDCINCHLKESINFHAADHAKGTVKISSLTDPSCNKCHYSSQNDLEEFKKSAIPSLMRASLDGADMVTCISCHKSDGKHYNTVTFTPDNCGSCHEKPSDCEAYNSNPLKADLINNFKESSHYTFASSTHFKIAVSDDGFLSSQTGQDFLISSVGCLSCHENASYQKYYAQKALYTDADGNKYYKSYSDNNTKSATESRIGPQAFGLTLLDDEDSSPAGIACATCHDLHNGGLTRKDVLVSSDSKGNDIVFVNKKEKTETTAEEPVTVFSSEFNLCTTCHFVKLEYAWDKDSVRFDYTLDRRFHDNTTLVSDLTDINQRAVKFVNGKADLTNANVYDYKNKQSAHMDYEGGKLPKELTIIDTHFKGVIVSEVYEKDGISYIAKREIVKGYNINAASKRACSSCHDEHLNSKFGKIDVPFSLSNIPAMITALKKATASEEKAITTTQTWAQSGHADYKSEPFTDDDYEKKCVKCHSGYEAAKYFTGVAVEKLDNVSAMLYERGMDTVSCVTCHSLTDKKENGTLKLGDVRAWKDDTFSFDWATLPYGDKTKDIISAEDLTKINDSVLCFSCHTGMNSAKTINAMQPSNEIFNKAFNRKELETHYANAAASYWGNAAYEFEGKSYTQGTFPLHAVNAGNKDGSFKTKEEMDQKEKTYIYNCVSCHDFYNGNHSAKSFITGTNEDGKEVITGINMTSKREKLGCNKDGCHGSDGIQHAGKAQGNKEGFEAALAEVTAQYAKTFNVQFIKEKKGFFNADDNTKEFTAWGKGGNAKELFGAAVNIYYLSVNDKGAYSHNPIYAKQLLWDMMEMAKGEFSDEAKFFMGTYRP